LSVSASSRALTVSISRDWRARASASCRSSARIASAASTSCFLMFFFSVFWY
jgi:hypothetical protein